MATTTARRACPSRRATSAQWCAARSAVTQGRPSCRRSRLAFRDLFDRPGKARDRAPRRVVAEYRYTDECGELLFVKVRYEPKGFAQKRPDGRGGWIWNLGTTHRVLYRLPEIVAAIREGQTVFLVEGEKDADRLARLGHCRHMQLRRRGQGRAAREVAAGVRRRPGGADVVIIADRDEAGVAHARAAAADLAGKAKSVAVMQAAVDRAHADVSDHLDAGFEPQPARPR